MSGLEAYTSTYQLIVYRMKIDCPYFDFFKKYPYHARIIQRYDSLLAPHGFEIQVRDTDHTYDCVRWFVNPIQKDAEKTDIVKQIVNEFASKFYGTCEKCGGSIGKRVAETFYFEGLFPDEGIRCGKCKFEENIVGRGEMIDNLLSFYGMNQSDDPELFDYVMNRKIIVRTKDNRITYCRFRNLRKINNEWFMVVPPRDWLSKKDNNAHFPSVSMETVPVIPAGFDLGLRDICGERVYSNTTAVILFQDRIIPTDMHQIWCQFYSDREKVYNGVIIVTGYLGVLHDMKILKNHYCLTYEELVSFVGNEEAKKYLDNPQNKYHILK